MSKFCAHCGVSLAQPNAAFCSVCGASLQGQEAFASAPMAPTEYIFKPEQDVWDEGFGSNVIDVPAYASVPPAQQQASYYGAPSTPVVSSGTAVLLEVLPGAFFQTFGIGHMYAGNIGLGLFFMLGYWFVTFINFLLCFIFIGFITWPLSWIAMLIVSAISASATADAQNRRAV